MKAPSNWHDAAHKSLILHSSDNSAVKPLLLLLNPIVFSQQLPLLKVMMSVGRGSNIQKKGRSYPYNEKFVFEFGLRVTGRNAKTGVVEFVVCCFPASDGKGNTQIPPLLGMKKEGVRSTSSQLTISTSTVSLDLTTCDFIWGSSTQSSSRNTCCCALHLHLQPRRSWLLSLPSQHLMYSLKKVPQSWEEDELFQLTKTLSRSL